MLRSGRPSSTVQTRREQPPRNRLDRAFARGRPVLVCYLSLGDPALPADGARVYADAGVDVIEIGIPSANPFADGPVVRDSMRRALDAGTTLDEVASGTRRIARAHGPALVWMSYADTATTALAAAAADCGVDGVLVPAGGQALRERLRARLGPAGVHLLGFVGTDSGAEAMESARAAGGYVMLQAAPGGTGLREEFDAGNAKRIAHLRAAGVRVPIVLGFGLHRPEHLRRAVECGADGVVVGTACIVKALEGREALGEYLRTLRRALDDPHG